MTYWSLTRSAQVRIGRSHIHLEAITTPTTIGLEPAVGKTQQANGKIKRRERDLRYRKLIARSAWVLMFRYSLFRSGIGRIHVHVHVRVRIPIQVQSRVRIQRVVVVVLGWSLRAGRSLKMVMIVVVIAGVRL
jgi:hypothetical protein